jgi:hypothetical protein
MLVACSGPAPPSGDRGAEADAGRAGPAATQGPAAPAPRKAARGDAGPAAAQAPAAPAAPGTPAGLADDRTPVSERPFSATSAQGAANVVQTYYALLEARRYADARRLWGGAGEASGKSADAFAAGFARYAEYHAEIGAPGGIEGAAGSLYVDVPVGLYGRRKAGGAYREAATVTLRRVNDVPGSTAAQRRWHIVKIAPRPSGAGATR